jgi:hypothetical protein
VAGTFDQEIASSVLSAPIHHFRSLQGKLILEANLGHYLTLRVYRPHDVQPELPEKIAKMANFLNIELKAELKSARWQILTKLCTGLAAIIRTTYGSRHILSLLSDEPHLYSYDTDAHRKSIDLQNLARELNKADEVIAAIAISNTRLVKKTLSQVADGVSFSVFGSPLHSAVRMGDLALVEAVVGVLGSKKSRREKGALALGSSVFGVEGATVIAVRMGRVDMVTRLLECLQAHETRPNKQFYTRLAGWAIAKDDVDCLKVVLAAVFNDQAHQPYVVPAALFSAACNSSHVKCIAVLVREGRMDLTSKRLSQWS